MKKPSPDCNQARAAHSRAAILTSHVQDSTDPRQKERGNFMQNGNLFIDLDDALGKAEIASEKGRYQGFQLHEDLAEEKTNMQKVYSWERIRIMSEIAFDYAFEVDRSLKEARELFNALWERTKEQEEKNNCAGAKQKGEEYREQISYMLSRIQDETYLRRIFTVVHSGFLKMAGETP